MTGRMRRTSHNGGSVSDPEIFYGLRSDHKEGREDIVCLEHL